MKKEQKNILWFKEITKNDTPIVGGKNASLGEMYSRLVEKGVNVPNGFALTSKAYWYYLKANKIDERIKGLFKKFDPKSIKSLEETSRAARKIILQGEIPEDLKRDILKKYKTLSGNYEEKFTDVAVRSSATAEDLPSISAEEMVLGKIGGEIRYLKIEEFFELSKKPENKNKIISISSFVKGRKVKWQKVEEIYQHPAPNKTLYKITTKAGREITITSNHSLIALDPDTFKTKIISINEVNNSTRIPSVRYLPLIKSGQKVIDVKQAIKSIPVIMSNGRIKTNSKNTLDQQYGLPSKININKDFAYFLGIYLAEGSIYEKNGCIDISCDLSLTLDRVRKFYKSINSYSNKKVKYKRKVRIQNVILSALLRDITGVPLSFKGKGRSCRIKYVPDFLFTQTKEIITEFLKGLFDGDGWTDKHGIGYCSLSKKLIGGIAGLLEMLEINYYIGKKCTTITIPLKDTEKFKQLIGFFGDKKNQKKLELLVKKYNKMEKHQDFIDTLPPSKRISELLEKALKPEIKLEKVKIVICPKCGGEMVKKGYYRDYKNNTTKIKRYKCINCGFSPGTRTAYSLKKKIVLKPFYYNKLGQFKKDCIPWNKGNRKRIITYGISCLRKIAEKINSKELLEIVNSDVIWDKVEKVEQIKYSGYVYDFVVPTTQNFIAGIGGIITHNTASFAGAHETYLNIKGEKQLLIAVKKCLASLFNARAIAYRGEKGFDHLEIALSVGVQKMIRSDLASSGIMFTLDTETGFRNVVVINSIYGIGEMIVKGLITPDEFFVFKPMLKDKKYMPIILKNLGRKDKEYIYNQKGGLKEISVNKEKQLKFSLSDKEILILARWGCLIEKHYGLPQDLEWAKDGKTGQLFIVQSRPETVYSLKKSLIYKEYKIKTKKKPALIGTAIGDKIGTGKVHIISDVSKISEFKKGEVLVTKMTDPDWISIMYLASAIVTDEGSKVCHAAIVSRELGVPCIVGTEKATKTFKNGQEVTVDCTQGLDGRIYSGKVPFEIKKYNLEKVPKLKTKIMINIGAPEIAFKTSFLPNDGVGLAREEFIIAEKIKIHPLALYHYKKLKKLKDKETLKIIQRIDEITIEHKDKREYFVKELAEGIAQIASAFWPKPVIVRFSDFKTNEYAQLIGGKIFEPDNEANPMLGWRGASRYYDEKFKPAFLMECESIKRVRNVFGLKNVELMIPFCRTVEEGEKVLNLMEKAGLKKGSDGLKIYVMCEIPSNIILAEEFLKIFDGYSIGSNDLTQLTLGIDRDNASLQKISDERNPAVKEMIRQVIKLCNQKKKYCGICGDAPSSFPNFAKFLLDHKILSISLSPDAVIKTILSLAKNEK